MNFMSLFKKPKSDSSIVTQTLRSSKCNPFPFDSCVDYQEKRLYDGLRFAVPIIDACICKIVRLTGGFNVICSDSSLQSTLDDFVENVPVVNVGKSLNAFMDCYLDNLLTYGNSIGEMLISKSTGRFVGLANGDISNVDIKFGNSPLEREYYFKGEKYPISMPNLILFSSINNPNGELLGRSILWGLSSLSSTLLKVYDCMAQNFDRVGNVRYAVTYKPSNDTSDRVFAKERAMQIAEEWSKGMSGCNDGQVRDFITMGNVDIKAIGSDVKMLDTDVPVRQLLEQILAKLSIPPFLIGLNWSTTERMSSQQADMLTSELEYYRRVITPTICDICNAYLRSIGSYATVKVDWCNINLQDEVELADARLKNAQAIQIETELGILNR